MAGSVVSAEANSKGFDTAGCEVATGGETIVAIGGGLGAGAVGILTVGIRILDPHFGQAPSFPDA